MSKIRRCPSNQGGGARQHLPAVQSKLFIVFCIACRLVLITYHDNPVPEPEVEWSGCKLGYKELDCECDTNPACSRIPKAVLDAASTVFEVGGSESFDDGFSSSHWTGYFADQQFYISAPVLSTWNKQPLVSLLSLAESLNCSCAWVLMDRSRPDFLKMVSILKYYGFRLSQGCLEDRSQSVSYALLRYEVM